MEEICIAALGDPRDPKVWSRTPSRIVDYFESQDGYHINRLNLKDISGVLFRASSLVGKLVYRRGTLRDPLIYRIEANRIAKKTYEIKADTFLFIAEHGLNYKRRPNAKYYVYLDSLLRPHLDYDKRKQKPFFNIFLKGYESNDRKSFEQMDAIFTQNQWSKDFINKEYGIPEERIHNVGFGINCDFYEGEKDYTKQQLMTVLRRGTEYVKGLPLLIETFKYAREEMPELKLAVFGTTAEQVEGITYYEDCPREVMLDMYKSSSLYVMPNILEPNGITYVEAMANKTPIVGLDRFSVPEFTGDGKYGFISPSESVKDFAGTIIGALQNPQRLVEMGRQGQAFVRNRYNWDSVLKKMERLMTNENERQERMLR